MAEEGKKYDQGKPRPSLLLEGMPNGLAAVIEVLEHGAVKYGPHNWKQVKDAIPRYKEALDRHAIAPEGILGKDPESNLLHVAHIACNALFLLELLHTAAKENGELL